MYYNAVCCPSCQMCGAGLLGWKRGGSGAHHHSWQGHVHRHPVQGESMHTQHDSPAVVCNSCLFTAYFIWYVCPLVLTVGYYISPNFFLLLFFILVFFLTFLPTGCYSSHQGDSICHIRIPCYFVLWKPLQVCIIKSGRIMILLFFFFNTYM